MTQKDPERLRLAEHDAGRVNWKRWGPYVSERAWGTVREDYSADGDAWNYFPHDHARSRAYRWNEDGLAGFCDDRQHHLPRRRALERDRTRSSRSACSASATRQGNHGEDVKEYYFLLDGTPTHSYMKMVYKYPQVAFPYDDARRGQRRARARSEPEYRAVRRPARRLHRQSLLRRRSSSTPRRTPRTSSAGSRWSIAGPSPAPIHVLPHLWYRNTGRGRRTSSGR